MWGFEFDATWRLRDGFVQGGLAAHKQRTT
jgi:hypothetical protein